MAARCPVAIDLERTVANEWAALGRAIGPPIAPRLRARIAQAEAAALAHAFDAAARARDFEAWKAELYEKQKGTP